MDVSCFRSEQHIPTQDNIEHEEVDQIGVIKSAGLSSTQVKAKVTCIPKATTVVTIPDTQVDKCEVCGRELDVDQTFTEQLLSVHLTTEGLCDIFVEETQKICRNISRCI